MKLKAAKRIVPQIGILIIGSEIVTGKTRDSNSHFLCQQLEELGFPARLVLAVGDSKEDICNALSVLVRSCNVILASGGLGPTHDDVTAIALSEFFKTPFIFHRALYARIERTLKHMRRFVAGSARRQACVPQAAQILSNRCGMAPGFVLAREGHYVLALPGVPAELRGMFFDHIRPFLIKHFRRQNLYTLTIRTIGIAEAKLSVVLKLEISKHKEVEVGFYPEAGEVKIRLRAVGKESLSRLKKKANQLAKRIVTKIRNHVYGVGEEPIESVIGKELLKGSKTLAVAESCTGGLLGKRLTDISGSSRYFVGGVIAYSNSVKEHELDVPSEILKRFGAISAQTAIRMAQTVRGRLGSSIGLSITGIAGPTGGSRKKPVGLVYIALSDGKKSRAERFQFRGSRKQIRRYATQAAFYMLWKYLTKKA